MTTRRRSSKNSSRCTRASRRGGFFDLEIIESRPGLIVAHASGESAELTFRDEAGGHRWQRIPPNERKGRVHTSTVTVAVLDEPSETQMRIRQQDVEIKTCRGSGAGGQHRNKVDSAVQITYLPTGLQVRCETERSQHQNKASAMALLRAKLLEAQRTRERDARTDARRQQVGSGMRGDKRRTIRCQDDQVVDHVTGRRWKLREYLRGEW